MSMNNQLSDDDQSSFSSPSPIFVDQKFGWVQTRQKIERETIEQYVKYFNCVARVNRWTDENKVDMFELVLYTRGNIVSGKLMNEINVD